MNRSVNAFSLIFFLVLFLFSSSFSQDIVNTLGGKTSSETFDVKDSDGTLLFSILGDGKIGIGNITPNALLDVDGSINIKTDNFLQFGGANSFLATSSNNFIGQGAGTNITTGTGLVFNGYQSGYLNTSGGSNTYTGFRTGYSNETGTRNVMYGLQAGYNNTNSDNSFVGYKAGFSNTTGDYNTFMGSYAGYSITSGEPNTFIGYKSGYTAKFEEFNTFIGAYSGYQGTVGGSRPGSYNTLIGYQTGYNIGYRNSAVGYKALYSSYNGDYNSAFGNNSLENNTNGDYNSAFGYGSLQNNTLGLTNSAFGHLAGDNITTGSNNTVIGANANASAANVSNEITLGDGNISSLRCNVTSISSLSDMRDKKEIKDLKLGIDFLMKIKPRQFKWDKREWYNNKPDGSKMEKELTAGFIAQELDKVQNEENAEWLNLVYKSNPNRLEATYGNLLPVMVKAIQDLKHRNDQLASQLISSEDEINALKKLVQQQGEMLSILLESTIQQKEHAAADFPKTENRTSEQQHIVH